MTTENNQQNLPFNALIVLPRGSSMNESDAFGEL
jgi:hypothetical protein